MGPVVALLKQVLMAPGADMGSSSMGRAGESWETGRSSKACGGALRALTATSSASASLWT